MYNENLRKAIFWCGSTFIIGQFSTYLLIEFLIRNDLFEEIFIIPIAGVLMYFSCLSFYIIPYKWMRMPTMEFYYRQLIFVFILSSVFIGAYFFDLIKTSLTSGQFVVPFLVSSFFPLQMDSWVESHLKKRYGLPADATTYQFKKRMNEVMKGEKNISNTI